MQSIWPDSAGTFRTEICSLSSSISDCNSDFLSDTAIASTGRDLKISCDTDSFSSDDSLCALAGLSHLPNSFEKCPPQFSVCKSCTCYGQRYFHANRLGQFALNVRCAFLQLVEEFLN